MIKIINDSIDHFYNEVQKSQFYLFGAGRRADVFYRELNLAGLVTAVVDNNEKRWSNDFYLGKEKIPVIGIPAFLDQIKGKSDVLLLITPAFFVWEIIEQLDQIQQIQQLRCYIGDLLIDYYEEREVAFTEGVPKIPKKIHYCWFGKQKIPPKLLKYMDTWREKCPEYEIVRWDESNYDVTKNQYMKEAYECGKWGFVPDYARLDIIYHEGGIYLDTDIELLSSLDKLLCDEMFCSALNLAVNLGQGFGAVKGHQLIKEMRDAYHDRSFYCKDGSMNLTPCYVYQHPVLKKYGFQIKNQYQKIGSAVIYPSEVAAPGGLKGLQEHVTKNTVMWHHSTLSWISEEERKHMEEYKRNIMHRVFYRWGGIDR